MGYGDEQVEELAQTIRNSDAEVVAIGTPIDLTQLIEIDQPVVRVTYELALDEPEVLDELLREALRPKELS